MPQSLSPITPLTPLAADLISVATQMSLQAGDMSPDLRLACDNIFDVAERVARMERTAIATLNPRRRNMTTIFPATNNPLDLACHAWSNPDYYQSSAPLLFLACPYSDPSVTIREERCAAASRVAARLMEMGYAVYSPVSHGHAIANYRMGVGTEYEAWTEVNDPILLTCDAMVVLGANTWSSRGVAHEVHLAEDNDIPINIIAERDGRIELLLPDADASMWPDAEDRS